MTYPEPQDPFATSSHLHAARRRPRLWLVALLATVLTGTLIAAGVLIPRFLRDASNDTAAKANTKADASFAPQPFSIRGFLTLKLGQFAWFSDTDSCYGYDRFSDIRSGTQVIVTDPSGATIALGQLDAGIPRHDPDDTKRVTECRFPIKVTGVPGEHRFYGLEISKHGKLDFARDRIEGPHELTLK